MTKRIIFLCFALVSFSYGQKKELRSANRFIEKGEYASAIDILDSTNDLIQASDDKIKARAMFLYGMIYTNTEDFGKAVKSFQTAKDLGGSNTLLDTEIGKLENAIITSSIGDQEAKNWDSAYKKLFNAYELNPERNEMYLYYAAGFSINAKSYNDAKKYFEMLIDLNYQGIETNYYITERVSGKEIKLSSESEYNIYKRLEKEYRDPREEETESKFPEIIQKITFVYQELGENEKALEVIDLARKNNPDDVDLIITASNIYFEMGELEMFRALTKEAISKDPTDARLFFNLGVVNSNLGFIDEAEPFYRKAIELDPSWDIPYWNLNQLLLNRADYLRKQQDKLSQSTADNKKYDEISIEIEDIYKKQSIPLLEKLYSVISPDKIDDIEDVVTQIMRVYATLGDNPSLMQWKTILDQLDQ